MPDNNLLDLALKQTLIDYYYYYSETKLFRKLRSINDNKIPVPLIFQSQRWSL